MNDVATKRKVSLKRKQTSIHKTRAGVFPGKIHKSDKEKHKERKWEYGPEDYYDTSDHYEECLRMGHESD